MDPNLFRAAVEGDINTLKQHAYQNLDLQLQLTPNKNTVLHINITAQSGKPKSAEFVKEILSMCPLLLLQANIKNEIPLHIAARHGNAAVVDLLIQTAKADTRTDPESPLESVIRQMLRMPNERNDTSLHEAARNKHLGVAQMLIKEDPDYSYPANHAGETPLYLAAERGCRDLVFEILSNCTSPALGGPIGRTALHAAAICKDDEAMTREILVHNAERTLSKEADEHGWIPLHYAAFHGHVSVLKLLLEFDISSAYIAEKTDHKTALHIAAGRGNTDLMKELLSRCPDCYEMVDYRGRNALHFAVESRCPEAVDLVLNDSSLSNLINEQDAQGNTPLHLLAASSFYQIPFIRHPKVDAMSFNKQNKSALDIALANIDIVSEAKESIVQCLEEVGSRRNMRFINPRDIDPLEAKDHNDGNIINSPEIDIIEVDEIDKNTEQDIKDHQLVVPDHDRAVRGDADNSNINDTPDNLEATSRNIVSDDIIRDFEKGKDPHLLVATLTATVTYAAGFTMPGGYISEKGPHQGQAVLTTSSAFQTFVIMDTIALMLSSFAVLIHLLAPLYGKREKIWLTRLFIAQYYFTTFSMLAMAIAFVAATYTVLSCSSSLAIATCVIGAIYAPISMLVMILFTHRLNNCSG